MYDITKTLFYRSTCKDYSDWCKEESEKRKNIRAAKEDESMKSEHEIKLHIERKERFLR